MFESGHVYRNRRMIDIDMLVTKVLGRGDDGVTLCVEWANRHSGFIHADDNVVIAARQFGDWEDIGELVNGLSRNVQRA